MISKVLSIHSKSFLLFCLLGLGWVFAGCAPAVLTPLPAEQPGMSPGQIEKTETIQEKPSPRALAALQLTDQGTDVFGSWSAG